MEEEQQAERSVAQTAPAAEQQGKESVEAEAEAAQEGEGVEAETDIVQDDSPDILHQLRVAFEATDDTALQVKGEGGVQQRHADSGATNHPRLRAGS